MVAAAWTFILFHSAIFPSMPMIMHSGTRMVSIDYAGVEARACAWASCDPYLIDSYWTGYDIHKYWSKRVLRFEPDNIRKFSCGTCDPKNPDDFKKYRNISKNRLVFPWMFGSSVRSVQHDMKIKEETAWTLNREYWGHFGRVREWQREMAEFYEEHGYVETLFGFRRGGVLSWNQLINMPIQGTAGELVLRAGNRLRRYGYQYSLNVHDDLSFMLEVANRRAERQIAEICEIMVEVKWKWINTPLDVEVEWGDNWADLETYKVFSSRDFGHVREVM